jgi:hypothetical protein
MSYISEIQGWKSSLPLLLKGRVGEGLRKRKNKGVSSGRGSLKKTYSII